MKNNYGMKNKIIFGIVLVWILFSIGYIGYDVWSDFKTKQLAAAQNQAYNQGKTDIVTALYATAEKSCDPISVTNPADGKQLEVINSTCKTTK